jgi:hypothetical protein
MFEHLVQNQYQFSGTMEIIDNIGVYCRMNNSNFGKESIFLEKNNPLLKEKINYFYIKDIPKDLLPNCCPNIFPNLTEKIKYLKIYINSQKYNRSKIIELYEESNIKEIKFNSNIINNRNNHFKLFSKKKN